MPYMCRNKYAACNTFHRNKRTAFNHLVKLNKNANKYNWFDEWSNPLVPEYKVDYTKYSELNDRIIYRPGMCFIDTDTGRESCGTKHSKESAAIKHLKKLGKGWDNILIKSRNSTKNRKKVYESKKYRPGMCFEGDNREKNCGVRHRSYNSAKKHIRKLQIKTFNMWNNSIVEAYDRRTNITNVDSYATKADVSRVNNAYEAMASAIGQTNSNFNIKKDYKYQPEPTPVATPKPEPVPENSRVKGAKQIKRFVF